jgi:hypothetical protein
MESLSLCAGSGDAGVPGSSNSSAEAEYDNSGRKPGRRNCRRATASEIDVGLFAFTPGTWATLDRTGKRLLHSVRKPSGM